MIIFLYSWAMPLRLGTHTKVFISAAIPLSPAAPPHKQLRNTDLNKTFISLIQTPARKVLA